MTNLDPRLKLDTLAINPLVRRSHHLPRNIILVYARNWEHEHDALARDMHAICRGTWVYLRETRERMRWDVTVHWNSEIGWKTQVLHQNFDVEANIRCTSGCCKPWWRSTKLLTSRDSSSLGPNHESFFLPEFWRSLSGCLIVFAPFETQSFHQTSTNVHQCFVVGESFAPHAYSKNSVWKYTET